MRARLLAVLLCSFAMAEQQVHAGPGSGTVDDELPNGAIMRFGTRKLRHEGRIYAVAYAPDGRAIASCSEDKSIRLWDPRTGGEFQRCVGHQEPVFSIAFSSDGKRLVSVGGDDTMRVWDVRSGALKSMQEVPIGRLGAVAISGDGKWIAGAGEEGTLVLWRTGGDVVSEARRMQASFAVRSVAFSPDSLVLAFSGEGGVIEFVDVVSGKVLRTFCGHAGWTAKVVFAPDGRFVASCGRDARVCLWDSRSGAALRNYEGCDMAVAGVCFSPDGRQVAAADYWGNIFVWETASGRELLRFSGDKERVADLAFSPDGKTLAAGSYDIRLFDVLAGVPRLPLDGHREEVSAVAFSPTGNTLASGGGHSAVYIWRLDTGRVRYRLSHGSHGVCDLAYSPDGTRLAAATMFSNLVLWDESRGQRIAVRAVGDMHDWRGRVSFSADGSMLSWAGGRGVVQVLCGRTGDNMRTIAEVDGVPESMDFCGVPERLCVATYGALHSIDVQGGSCPETREFRGRSTAWTPDGRLVVRSRGIGGGCELQDARRGTSVRMVEDDVIYEQLRFSHDGRWIGGVGRALERSPDGAPRPTTRGEKGAVRVWEVATGKLVADFVGHAGPVLCVAFSADGRLLATGGVDTTVIVWKLDLMDRSRSSR